MLSSDGDFRDYVKSIYIPDASNEELTELLDLYPDDITQGSPYDTGFLNALTPQFKRLASFQGDVVFQVSKCLFAAGL